MVVDNGDILGAGQGPAKDDAPLVVDADGVLACPPPFQRLQPIARRDAQIGELAGEAELNQFSAGDGLDGGRQLGRLPVQENAGQMGSGRNTQRAAADL